MVFPTENGKYIVAEGNRRVAVLKILNDPNLIQGGDPSLVKNSRPYQTNRRAADCRPRSFLQSSKVKLSGIGG